MRDPSDKITLRLLGPIVVVGLVLILLSLSGGYWLQKRAIDGSVRKGIQGVQRLLQGMLLEKEQIMSGQMAHLKTDQDLLASFLAGDREGLIKRAGPLFEGMKSRHQITHLYFHGPDRICFLRVHAPDRHGDLREGLALTGAVQSGQPASGLELDPPGTFTLRVVHPWLVEGRLVGYIELGMKIEHLTQLIKRALKVDLFILVEKKFLDRGEWEAGLRILNRSGDWERFSEFVIIERTMEDTPALEECLQAHQKGEGSIFSADLGGRPYKGGLANLIDAGGRRVGEIVSLVDVSVQERDLMVLVVFLAGLSLAIGGGLVAFFYIYIGGIQKRLIKSREKIEAEIEERRRSEAALQVSEERYRSLFEGSKDAIVTTDAEGGILMANPAARELFRFGGEEVEGGDFNKLFADPGLPRKLAAETGEKGFVRDFEARLYGQESPVMDCLLTVRAKLSAAGEVVGYEGIIRDVTPFKRMEEELRRLATIDSLTGVNNRRNYLELTQMEIRRAQRYRNQLSLIMLDIDHFKKINDTYGHSAGDLVLTELGSICRQEMRESDIIGRLGGEEFAITLTQSGQEEALALAERLRAVVSQRSVKIEEGEFRFTASFGVAWMSPGEEDLKPLLDRADRALYEAKKSGRNRVRAAD